MDKKTKKEIMNRYFHDYYRTILNGKKGLIWKPLKWQYKNSAKWGNKPAALFIGLGGLTILTLAVILPASIGLLASLVAAVSVGTFATGSIVIGSLVAQGQANSKMEKDIKNGRLINNYKKDIIHCLKNKISLPANLSARLSFKNAASNTNTGNNKKNAAGLTI